MDSEVLDFVPKNAAYYRRELRKSQEENALLRKQLSEERERCCSIVFGMCGSDNVAQRTVDKIRGNV